MLDGTSVTEPPLNWIELPVTDIGLIALLKFTLTPALVPMLVNELGGASAAMVGATLSTAVPPVKEKQPFCAATPSVLVTLLRHTWYCELATRLLVGAMLITWPLPTSDRVGVR